MQCPLRESLLRKKNNMQKQYLFGLLFLFTALLFLGSNCYKKSKCEEGPFVKGNIIGFDPCTAFSQIEKGYVIKFDDRNDTIIAYFVLPETLKISDSLFYDYRNSYLFPMEYRNKFFIKAKYRESNSSEYKVPLCRPDILMTDFIQATKLKQYTIECISQ